MRRMETSLPRNVRPAVSSGMPSVLQVDDPYTGAIVYAAPYANGSDVEAVVDRAKSAAGLARRTSVQDRTDVCEKAVRAMENRREEIAREISVMMGKPFAQAQAEVSGMAVRARYMM